MLNAVVNGTGHTGGGVDDAQLHAQESLLPSPREAWKPPCGAAGQGARMGDWVGLTGSVRCLPEAARCIASAGSTGDVSGEGQCAMQECTQAGEGHGQSQVVLIFHVGRRCSCALKCL